MTAQHEDPTGIKAANARIAMIPNGAGARMEEMERQDPCPDVGAIEVGKLMEQTT
tara:strand:+ start:1573 stop:1737 length:165 start_codon:yes stop_codon:yes gene_type:complete